MSVASSINSGAIAAWYMTSSDQKLLVIHYVSSAEKSIKPEDRVTKPIALLGTAYILDNSLTLGPNSSVVFKL